MIGRALVALGLVLAVLGVMAPAQATQNPPELPVTGTNPALEPGCGIDIGVVIDRSGSIADAGKAQVYKDAVNGLIDAFAGTPSTIGFWSFGNAASPTAGYPWQGMTAVGGADYETRVADLKVAVQAIPIVPGVATNWEAGIAAPMNTLPATDPIPDLVIVVTDGDPTTYNGDGSDSGSTTNFNDLAKGIESANAIKGWGARVFAAGVGGATVDNLKLISGGAASEEFDPVAGNVATADYLIASFDDFDSALKDFATDICGGSVTVTKLASTPEAPDDYTAAAGWSFAASLASDTALTSTPDPAITGVDGTVNFKWSSVSDETITITETQQEGFTLQDVECTNGEIPLQVAQVTDGVQLTVGNKDIVNCTFKNKAAPPPPSCPEGTTWVDGNDNGKVDEGECETPPPPRCPQGQTWVDANENGRIDEGECRTPPPPPPFDQCPLVPGTQPAGTDCSPPPPPAVDQCPDDAGLQTNPDQCTTPEVLPEVVTPPVVTPPAPQVEGEVITAPAQLPRTGDNPLPLLQVGLGLIMVGAGSMIAGRRRTI